MGPKFVHRLLIAGLCASIAVEAVAQEAPIRPYADLSAGIVDWGRDSPCGCTSFSAAVAAGVRLPGHLRLGARLESVEARRGNLYLGPELSYGFLPHERLRVSGAWAGALRRRKSLDGDARAEYSGYVVALDLRYHPWAKRNGWRGLWLSGGYRYLSQEDRFYFDDRLAQRERDIHIGWRIGVGYHL